MSLHPEESVAHRISFLGARESVATAIDEQREGVKVTP